MGRRTASSCNGRRDRRCARARMWLIIALPFAPWISFRDSVSQRPVSHCPPLQSCSVHPSFPVPQKGKQPEAPQIAGKSRSRGTTISLPPVGLQQSSGPPPSQSLHLPGKHELAPVVRKARFRLGGGAAAVPPLSDDGGQARALSRPAAARPTAGSRAPAGALPRVRAAVNSS